MKKIIYLIISAILLTYINACAGYKPIFSSPNIQFQIVDYSIKGNKKIAKQLYSKLFNLSNSNINNQGVQKVHISIEVTKEKIATVKNSAGKILEYKVNLNSNIVVKNFLTDDEVLSHNFAYFLSYKVLDQYSETVKLENTTIENLVNKTYQDLLIKMSENMSAE